MPRERSLGGVHYKHYDVDMANETKTQPFSIRLTRSANLLVQEEMRRTGRSRSAVVEELADEAAKMRIFPGIAFKDEPRRAWVIGTGLDVWELVEIVRGLGDDLDAVRDAYPRVTERHIRLAQAYAERFPEEIEARIEANNPPLDELLERYPFIQVAR
jgi:uncharacterized protein (DUF433 family)